MCKSAWIRLSSQAENTKALTTLKNLQATAAQMAFDWFLTNQIIMRERESGKEKSTGEENVD